MKILFTTEPWAVANGEDSNTVYGQVLGDNEEAISSVAVELNLDGSAVFKNGTQKHSMFTDVLGEFAIDVYDKKAEIVSLRITVHTEPQFGSSVKLTFVEDTAWGQFKQLKTLSVDFVDSPSSAKAKMYANSLNQVGLVVKFAADGLNGLPLEVPLDLLRDAIKLCDYTTGEPIEANWILSYEAGAFNRAIEYSFARDLPAENRAVTNVIMYISSDKALSDKTMAVSLLVDGVGSFDTTAEGTPTLNGPAGVTGSVFKSPSSVVLTTVAELDYSLPSTLEVTSRVDGKSSYVPTITDIRVERIGGDDVDDGVYSYQAQPTYIKPIKADHSFSKERTSVNRKYASLSHLNLVEKVDQTFSIPFSGVQKADEWTYVYGLWVDVSKIGSTSGGIHMTQSRIIDKNIIYHTDDRDLTVSEPLRDDAVAVRTMQYDITIDELFMENWSHSAQTTEITVQDNFGNKGIVTVQLVNKGGEDANSYHPYLKVNGE